MDAEDDHGDTLKVRIVDQYRGKSIDLGVPLKGFSEAHAPMMAELAKQKAGKTAPQTQAPAPAPRWRSSPTP